MLALILQIVVFWVVTLCSLVSGYQHFGGNVLHSSSDKTELELKLYLNVAKSMTEVRGRGKQNVNLAMS
jgi:hypothetical protein